MRRQLAVYLVMLGFALGVMPKVVLAQRPEPDTTFTTIDFPGAISTGGPLSRLGNNPAGRIVGRYRSADGKFHGFLLRDGEFTTIDSPGALLTAAHAINARGDIVGAYDNSDNCLAGGPRLHCHGFLLMDGAFYTIDFPGSVDSFANGINSEGQILRSR